MICVSLADDSLFALKSNLEKLNFVEIRLDAIEIKEKEVYDLMKSTDTKIIATCRKGRYSDAERTKLLLAAIRGGVDYIDIDIESEDFLKKELVHFAKLNSCKVILSYHNFDHTPDVEELEGIIKKCFRQRADIAKIACMAQSNNDTEKVLSLYKKHKNIVAFCMGELGKSTRVDACFLGAPYTYASLTNDSKTAPGQISYAKMKNLISEKTDG